MYKKLNIKDKIEIPSSFRKYFWDCNFDEISLDRYPFFIVERILRYGNTDSIEWLLNVIELDLLQSVLKNSRNLDKKTKNYWESILQ